MTSVTLKCPGQDYCGQTIERGLDQPDIRSVDDWCLWVWAVEVELTDGTTGYCQSIQIPRYEMPAMTDAVDKRSLIDLESAYEIARFLILYMKCCESVTIVCKEDLE